jgi:hypothetical protein
MRKVLVGGRLMTTNGLATDEVIGTCPPSPTIVRPSLVMNEAEPS